MIGPTKSSIVFVGPKSMETTHGKTNQALTDTEIKAAKPKDTDYQLYDGRKTGNFSLDWHCLQGEGQDDSVRKVIYLAIKDASKKWSMPIQNW